MRPFEQPDETEQPKGIYTATEPVRPYGRTGRDGQVIEADALDEPRFLSGYEELRWQAAENAGKPG